MVRRPDLWLGFCGAAFVASLGLGPALLRLTWTAIGLGLVGLLGLSVAELMQARPPVGVRRSLALVPTPHHPGTGGNGPSVTSST